MQELSLSLKMRETRAELERKKLQDEYEEARLLRLVPIIGKEPGILKFIYIDKLGRSVKMIPPSDSGLFSDALESERPNSGANSRQIDNLK